jgi:hypothetical protein
MPRITIACPEALIPDANQLAAALGQSMADAETFNSVGWQDATSNLFSAASVAVSDSWIVKAQEPLVRPEWDTAEEIDMVAASRAQAVLVFVTEPTPATIDQITAMIWDDGLQALDMMGLVIVAEESLGKA